MRSLYSSSYNRALSKICCNGALYHVNSKKCNVAALNTLVSGGELGGVVEGVDRRGVGKVVVQVLEWALAGDNSLDEEAEHGEHSQTAVLDLLYL